MSKRLTAPYRSGRSGDWLKVKNPDSPAMIRAREAKWCKFELANRATMRTQKKRGAGMMPLPLQLKGQQYAADRTAQKLSRHVEFAGDNL